MISWSHRVAKPDECAMTDIVKLLFVTKFDELGFDALKSLLPLRKAALDHVVFLYVIERERVSMHRGVGYQKDEEIKLRETANIRFIDWAENLYEQGMEVGVYIVVGGMVSEVIKAAKKEESDLIVIGRSQKGILEQLYSGSDVTELLRRASTPVLVYKYRQENGMALDQPFERPLLATDWSPASLKAVAYLKELKDVVREINVMHVAREKELKGASAMEVQETRKRTRRKLEDICDIFETNGIPAKAHVYVGDPVQEIERAARECGATMIAMGSSGKALWAERWIGSIPRKISEKSVRHTLLIPPDRE